MNMTFDFSNVYQENIGPKAGITAKDFQFYQEKFPGILNYLRSKKHKDEITYINLADHPGNLEELFKAADQIRTQFENVVLIGIGGSALGPMALFKAMKHPYHNELPPKKRNAPRFYVLDNVDPDYVESLLDVIDLKKSAFIVITKSGSTAETISNFMFILGKLQQMNVDFKKQLFFITDPVKGRLRELAEKWKVKTFDIPPGVGGRFSVLSPVGLLPAAVLGIDVYQLLDGARKMIDTSLVDEASLSPAFTFAAVHHFHMMKGRNIHVMFPYSNELYFIADWFRQLWAESLGKKMNRKKETVHVGPTPVKALGTTDQHSQVQLYVEGPDDKVYTFLEVREFNKKGEISGSLPFDDFSYLEGKSLEALINAEKKATELALTSVGRPNMTIVFSKINAYNIGALLAFFELSTDIMGELLDINAFDQPGVEHGKVATYALMGRIGYEEKKKEIETGLKSKTERVFRF